MPCLSICARRVPLLVVLLLGGLVCVLLPQVKKNGSKIQVEVDVNYKTNYESNYWRGILDAQGKTDGGYY